MEYQKESKNARRNGKHRKMSNQKSAKSTPRIYKPKRALPQSLKSYNKIIKTVKGLFPQSYRGNQILASEIYRSGVDPNSIKDTITAGSTIFEREGEERMKELSGLIKDHRKKTNRVVKRAINPTKYVVNRPTKPTKPIIQESALKGHLKSYIIKGIDGMDYLTFLNHNQKEVKNIVNKHEKPIKMRMTLSPKLSRGKGKEVVYCYPHFNTKYNIITESTNFDELYKICKEKIIEDVETFNNKGSGWIFEKIIDFRVHIDKFNPLSAKSYIQLPDKIRKKEAIINVQNKDNQCFKWSVLSCLFPVDKNSTRVSKKMKLDSEKLCWDQLEFPVQVDKIHIFEKNNLKYAVNVYSYDKEVKPIRISDNDNREKTINLLLISNDETNHYCWIKSMSRLLNSQTNKNGHTWYYCERCLSSFKTEKSLDKHSGYCKDHEAVRSIMPKKGTILKFKNHKHSMRVPFVIYADFECLTEPISSCQPDEMKSYTQRYQKHNPSGFSFMIKCYDDELMEPEIHEYTAETEDDDVAQKFVSSLEKSVRKLHQKFKYSKKVIMTEEDNTVYEKATQCHICDEVLNGDKVLDHDHLTGKYRGAAHNRCNLSYKIPKFIPTIMHNLSGYDAHLFIKQLGVSEGKIDCIPNNEEKYISFKKEIKVDEFVNKKGKTININKELRFIDSFKFMTSSLDQLVGNLEKDQFKNLGDHFEGEQLELMQRKGVYSYDYVNSLERLNETSLPLKEEFYNKLNNTDISDEDYQYPGIMCWPSQMIKNCGI